MTRSQIIAEIQEFRDLIADPDTPADQKETFQAALEAAEAKLAATPEGKKATKPAAAKSDKPAKAKDPKKRKPKAQYNFKGLSTEECEAIVKEAEKQRKVKKLEKFKKEQLKSGASAEAVEKMTFADMRPKLSVAQKAQDKACSMVNLFMDNHSQKVASAPKGKSDELKKYREKLEAKAAKEVAEFAKEQAIKVARELKAFVEELEEKVA